MAVVRPAVMPALVLSIGMLIAGPTWPTWEICFGVGSGPGSGP
ncbi:Uncharacterised protein [Mycobacterium tuberculosis]|nr:Uncharacterised protein [Mycobacterium tuberculosis]